MVSEAVVDLLEPVEIDHEHGEEFWFRAWLERHTKTLEEEPAVRQPGEIVGACLSSAVRKRSELPKRKCGPTDGDDQRDGRENDAELEDLVVHGRVENDAERAHEKQHRNEIRRVDHLGVLV